MEQQPRLPLWFLVANWGLIVLAFGLGRFLGAPDLPAAQLQALELVHKQVLESYIEPKEPSELLDTAIQQMVRSLDDFSVYVPTREVANYDERTTGRYEGIGMRPLVHEGRILVGYPFTGSPAEAAGLRPGDHIVAVDGNRLGVTTIAAASELLRGPADSEVKVTVARGADETTLTVRRGTVQRSPVKWAHFVDREAGLGYVHLSDFHRGCAKAVVDAIVGLQTPGPLRGLVLDLRFDGGGDFDECIALARAFVRSGTIVSTRRRGSEVVEQFEATPENCRFPDLPLVVLVDQGSASASEVLAGALQDHGRASIVGVRTYGKGVVNTVYSWRSFRLKLTTAHYYTPKGRSLARGKSTGANDEAQSTALGGVLPEVLAPISKAQREAVGATLGELEPPAAYREAFAAVAAQCGVAVPGPPRVADDPQLAAAVDALRHRIAGEAPPAADPAPKAR